VIQDEPRQPRRLNDQIPRDLETICLKAMAKEAARRYATARDLSEDLRRFLSGEIIQARPAGVGERLWRWCKRRPAVALLIGVSSAALSALLFGSLYHNARLNVALQNEKEQQARAELNFQKARDAVDRMLTRVGENKELEGIPQWQAHRQKLLEDALEFYQGFLKVSDEPPVRREAGRAHARLGRIYLMLGKRQEAIQSFQHAIVLQEQLANEFPSEPNDAAHLASSYHELGFLHETGQFTEAQEVYRKALAIREQLTRSVPGNLDYEHDLATTLRRLSSTLTFTGQKAAAEAAIDRATNLLDQLVRQHKKDTRIEISYAETSGIKALMLREDGKLNDSLDWYTRAVQLLESVLDREPQSIDAKVWLSWRLMERAETLIRLDRIAEARKDWERRAELGDGQSHIDLRLGRAMALAQLGQHIPAVAEIETMLASGQEPQQASYNFACVYALSVAAAERDQQLSPSDRKQLIEQYGQKAVNLLRKAQSIGFFTQGTISYMENDSDLKPIQAREDFTNLLQELQGIKQ
jgi:tetratricopeptide (TPR) repeat protein